MKLLLDGREATPEEVRLHELKAALDMMHMKTALRWCESKECACLGAANCSGGLAKKGFTRKEWEAAILNICRSTIASFAATPRAQHED